ncbi:hypothetical protein HAX54_025769 [Datura stramonium]|uniref:Uncharacterized protein n=1 Tax=Datura stramonium TaxID=4076 RepID=A0ABS8S6J0_DATST|nr:hypothetical protein [Datura stramonium]
MDLPFEGHQKRSRLLTTWGDGNNSMYPIAFAVVKGFGGQAYLKDILWKAVRETTNWILQAYGNMTNLDPKAISPSNGLRRGIEAAVTHIQARSRVDEKLRREGIDETTQKESDSRKLTLLKHPRKRGKINMDHVENELCECLFLWEATTAVQQRPSPSASQEEGFKHHYCDACQSDPSSFISDENVNQQPTKEHEQLRSYAFILEGVVRHFERW